MTQFGTHKAASTTTRPIISSLLLVNGEPGQQWRFRFANGYGASVINDGYGKDSGLYELAVLDATGALTYDTPITDDVLGYLTADAVTETLDAIAALPAEVKR